MTGPRILDDDDDFADDGRYDPKIFSVNPQARQAAAVKANDAFVAAMNAAIKKGREKVSAGTTIDLTPPIGALRLRGTIPISACGSPAALCMDQGGAHSGAETMK